MKGLRTWVEIDEKRLAHNVGEFFRLIPKSARLMAVIKSNAYGHGLVLIAKILAGLKSGVGSSQSRLWFGVDSITEGLRLREEGITNPVLVLGATLPSRIQDAEAWDIALTISNFESLRAYTKANKKPVFHLKFDTGMHRQGFLENDLPTLVSYLKKKKFEPQGVYTHFAAAKDIAYPTYTNIQLKNFNKAVRALKQAGFSGGVRHAAASGGTLLFPESHFDMVRVGMGLYGYFPSLESKLALGGKVRLYPVLQWHTRVSEIKSIPAESFVGYDLTEQVSKKTKIAVLPVGYWHGYDRGFSGIGEVLIRGARAKILGRVSMDMVVADVTKISKVKVGDIATFIGAQGKESLWADEFGAKIGTSQYEVLTRINPLIKRIVV